MSVVKVIEIVGGSPDGFKEAVEHALAECCKTVRNVVGIEVINWTCNVEGGRIREFKVNCKIAFAVDEHR
ncbi:MAG: dodecin family protein [Bacillota bacterium]|nr:dodecin family protein [Bacillota bacterium]